jgi:endoglucanase
MKKNKKENFKTALLAEICETPGAPGFEQRIRQVVLREIKNLADDIQIDNMGNVVALKKGTLHGTPQCKKVMIAAHMDEIGFMVTYIDEDGFLRFTPLGGFDPKTLTAQRVIVHGKKDVIGVMGTKPIHVMTPEERNKVVPISDYFIDLGMPKKEVEKIVSVGNPITRQRELIEMGECVNVKSLDNRVSVFILIETLRLLKKHAYDVYAVFTVQEEVGIRGANAAALQIQPDFGFGLDTTLAYDVPGAKPQDRCTRLGDGTAIKVMDASTICDYRMVNYMKETAEKHNIKYQLEILAAGGTDTAGIQRMNPGGAISGAVSIPTRHIHQVVEMCHKGDILNSISLLQKCIEGLDKYDWSFK